MTRITSTPERTLYSFEDDSTAVELTIAGDDTDALCHRGPRDEEKAMAMRSFFMCVYPVRLSLAAETGPHTSATAAIIGNGQRWGRTDGQGKQGRDDHLFHLLSS